MKQDHSFLNLKPVRGASHTTAALGRSRFATGALLLFLAAAVQLTAKDVYYRAPLGNLKFTDGELPSDTGSAARMDWHIGLISAQTLARMDGPAEAYLSGDLAAGGLPSSGRFQRSFLLIQAPESQPITGCLYVPSPAQRGLQPLHFTLNPTGLSVITPDAFLEAKEAHYRELRQQNLPGTAWFRHQEQETLMTRTGQRTPANQPAWQRDLSGADASEQTYSLFTGGRAVAENLQLDRALRPVADAADDTDLSGIAGITVAPFDWKPMLNSATPALDPLASAIPADQHALFFPSFNALMELMDEADTNATPLLRMIEPRAEDMDTRHRYQKQLCLGLSEISRRLGPQVVEAIALTGSDPYLRMGTDLGVLFQTRDPALFKSLIAAQQGMVSGGNTNAKAIQGSIEGITFSGVASPDRTISSFLAAINTTIFVSNSTNQLAALIQTAKGSRPALSSQDDYRYFRTRYRAGDPGESAFLILSDATIRRWCGPRWRIADARRVRAASVLSELQAGQLAQLAAGHPSSGAINSELQIPGGGQLTWTGKGAASDVYGTLDFMTPIAELGLDKVTKAEAESYGRWRDSYQMNWSQMFDPIAARFSVKSNRISLEMTVMPLIASTQYRELINLSTGARFAADAGDPHDGTLAQFIMAINPESTLAVQAGNFVSAMNPKLKVKPFGWLGSSIALYVEDAPLWNEFQQATNSSQFLESHVGSLPVALRCEVANPLGAAAFLGALRAYAEQTAPGMAEWRSLDYHGKPYVQITSSAIGGGPDGTNRFSIYYATSPESLVFTLSEALLKRALDREDSTRKARSAGGKSSPLTTPWLGTNLSLSLNQKFLTLLDKIGAENFATPQQKLAWNNLPILNEWKRLFPAEDPVKIHGQFWQTKLVCPGGGSYVWNEKWQTMESTVYGHPGEPKAGPPGFGPLNSIRTANFGVNFESQGLSAKAIFERINK